MKTSIQYFFLAFLTFLLGANELLAQDPMVMSRVPEYRVYYDTGDNNRIYQPATGASFPWTKGQTLYFAWHEEDLVLGTDQVDVANTAGVSTTLGTDEYTISGLADKSGTGNPALVNLFFDYFSVEDDSDVRGYGLCQFTTILQTALDNPNSLMTQSYHVQIANRQLFRIAYKDVSDVCTDVDFQFVVTW